jgi:hypothetical protein
MPIERVGKRRPQQSGKHRVNKNDEEIFARAQIATKVPAQSRRVPLMCQLRTTTCDPRNKEMAGEIPAITLKEFTNQY